MAIDDLIRLGDPTKVHEKANNYPAIEVFRYPAWAAHRDGNMCFAEKLVSLSNRRLFIWRVLAFNHMLESIPIRLKPFDSYDVQKLGWDAILKEERPKYLRSLTSKTGGTTTCIRQFELHTQHEWDLLDTYYVQQWRNIDSEANVNLDLDSEANCFAFQ